MAGLRELTLDDMLADPIVRLVMLRDGVAEIEVRSLMTRVGGRLALPTISLSAPASTTLSEAA